MGSLRILLVVALAASLSFLGAGCAKEGCLDGSANCRVAPPCPRVTFQCDDPGQLELQVISSASQRPGGLDALGAKGDIRLSNGKVEAVIAGLGNQNYLDPNGGSLLDLGTVGDRNDGLNQVVQVTGILPADSAHYTHLDLIDERPTRIAVQLTGTLDGFPRVPIYTRYELTPCDPGVRIRTEVVNGTTDTHLWALSDGFYWSKREALPFTPGAGFTHPSFNLLTINDAFRRFPFLAASSHAAPYASYAEVSCDSDGLEGFQSETVSTAGVKRTIVPPREYLTFDRFLAVTRGDDVASAADLAFQVREQLFQEKTVTLSGTVTRGGESIGAEREASVQISEGALGEERQPWTQVVPDAQGHFHAKVPADRTYVLEAHSFGRLAVEKEVHAGIGDLQVGELVLPSTARLTLAVVNADTAAPIDAEVFLIPADPATRQRLEGTLHGQFGTCSPWLGPPPGASPACNRVLVREGTATLDVPPGRFHLYAFHGPFWTLGHQTVELLPRDETVSFALRQLPLQPAGTLSADLHVHGAASFDSSIPDFDRVLSFSASDVQVIVATDHDVVYDYGAVVQSLGLQDRISTVTGVETTGHIPFFRIPGSSFPLVIGHYNFWPLRYDPSLPRNGAPFDELLEPGALFDATMPLFTATPVIELNHPWAEAEFGRDLGFPRALALDTTRDLPSSDDGTSAGIYVRAPGGKARNDDHHAQEVMNGSQNDLLPAYRAFWFFTLNQGRLKTGTANSDSHSLVDNTLGMPRNLVKADTVAGTAFDVDRFNQALRAGASIGTNGPVIEATVRDDGGDHSPALAPLPLRAGATLKLRVAAAPWVPVTEVRIIVNGKLVATHAPTSPAPTDPFGNDGLVRFEKEVSLADLLPAGRDAWLVVEAGTKLPLAGDLGGTLEGKPDGIPDTSDNNGDGVVDAADVRAGAKYGPLAGPPPPDEGNPLFHFWNLTQGYPMAFTNPFVFDVNGNGAFDAPGAGGSR